MARAVFDAPHFHNEQAAFAYVESLLWPRGPVCPHCQAPKERIGVLTGRSKPSKKNPEGVERHGLRKCYACRKSFTVRVGTIFEDSHLPLRYWLQVIHLMSASKKGISTRQIQRMLQCSMKTAWHLTHRIRLAMADGGDAGPLGGFGKHVEADETYYGTKANRKVRRGTGHKRVIVSLVERGGDVRSFHVETANILTVRRIVDQNVDKASTLNTDEAAMYKPLGREFFEHQTVNHQEDEYVRGTAYTNTLEGYFSIFKRGMVGVYQQCSETHLHRYLAEFDFRYNARQSLGVDDQQRTSRAVMGSKGKRLTYERLG